MRRRKRPTDTTDRVTERLAIRQSVVCDVTFRERASSDNRIRDYPIATGLVRGLDPLDPKGDPLDFKGRLSHWISSNGSAPTKIGIKMINQDTLRTLDSAIDDLNRLLVC